MSADQLSSDQVVKEVVAQLLDLEEDGLSMEQPLADIEEWDSVNALRVLVYLERELGEPVDYDRFMKAELLADLSALVADVLVAR
ncbi:phosphopantetheine-binding protein [Kitasatospora sp. NBC_01287]|uniref:acyl carrier protein n=1 Tax=Kitasatospora sp. NBC_01287 TaxID=2903573 RepID=UPI00224EDE90|nr:phosphopantetheine-binding protein [Kitasatospora sp. NBC_01287]MCX4748867.1 phosphopantetheine-binding protein [Kitasatospora sp. NBC_01287]